MSDYRVTLTYEIDADSEEEAIEIAQDCAKGDVNVGGFSDLEFKANKL